MKKYTTTTIIEVIEEHADGSVTVQKEGEPLTRFVIDGYTFATSYKPVKEAKRVSK